MMTSKFIYRFFKGNEKKIEKNNFIWNTIAGGVNAAEVVVLMMIVSRTSGVEDAGVLSIAFAVGNLLMTIGKFGVRNYQVTDINDDYSFNNYFTLRVITTLLMIVSSISYIGVKIVNLNYSNEKALSVLGVCLIYIIESFEDVFLGLYQKKGRLDIASKVFVTRWIGILLAFMVCSVMKLELVFCIYVSLAVSLVIEIIVLCYTTRMFTFPIIRIEYDKIRSLLKQCLSLFLVTFLTYYVTNSPKYAIDTYMTEEIQGYYGYISMPVFVIELLNCFFYQPQLVDLAKEWNERRLDKFNRRVYKQFCMIMIITIFCVCGAYFLGIPVLSFLYSVDLGEYKRELIILMISGGALACVGYTSVLLTIMRKQKLLLYNMIVITILAIMGFGKITHIYGIIGTVCYYLLLMVLLVIISFIEYLYTLKQFR